MAEKEANPLYPVPVIWSRRSIAKLFMRLLPESSATTVENADESVTTNATTAENGNAPTVECATETDESLIA